MFKFILTILIILLGFSRINPSTPNVKKEKTPFGTKYVKTLGYYVDKHAITMRSWREYYYDILNHKGDSAATLCLPDTNIISARYGSNVFKSNSHKDSAVVGLSIAQIKKFCQWRTEIVKQTKKLAGTTVSYHLLDSAMYVHLVSIGKIKGISIPSPALPEIIQFGQVYKVLMNKENSFNYGDYKGAFGFRCIAKYNEPQN